MKSRNYLVLLILLLSNLCRAQSPISGLGTFRIEATTPDSLARSGFLEDEQSYVKGTLALPCTHIRTFSCLGTEVAGVSVSNLHLAFYDNRLFKISCDYSPELEAVFSRIYGKGVTKPTQRFVFCDKSRPMLLWGEIWQTGDSAAYVIHTKGHTADCTLQETTRLIIISQHLSALASDCDVQNTDLLADEFERTLTNSRAKKGGTRKDKE